MTDSRTILTQFLSIIEQEDAFKNEIAPVINRLKRLDLRKSSARITLWNILTELKSKESSQSEAIDGLMADLAIKWQDSLGKALQTHKISK